MIIYIVILFYYIVFCFSPIVQKQPHKFVCFFKFQFYFTVQHLLKIGTRSHFLIQFGKNCPGHMAQVVGAMSHIAGSIPSQGTYLGCWLGPGGYGRQPMFVSLISFSFSLKINKKHILRWEFFFKWQKFISKRNGQTFQSISTVIQWVILF